MPPKRKNPFGRGRDRGRGRGQARGRGRIRSLPEAVTSEAKEMEESSSTAIKASDSREPVPLDPSSTKQTKSSLRMLNKLYHFCIRKPKAHEESSVLVNMFGIYLTRKESYTMRPKGWLSLMVVLAAGKIMMEEEKATNGVVTRHIFSPLFMNKVISESNLSKDDNYKPWCIEDVSQFVLQRKLGYDISQCKLIFAPTLFEEHWSCYAFEPMNKTLYVLDSMSHILETSKKSLDDATKLRFEELLVLLNPDLTKENASITLVHVDVPMQRNIDDCGIYVLKYMETWDGSIKCEDKTMPAYSCKEILKFRQSFICEWVKHPQNEVREEILKAAGVWGKLN